MKAILLTQYGSPDMLQLSEVEKPTPTDNHVLGLGVPLISVTRVKPDQADASHVSSIQ